MTLFELFAAGGITLVGVIIGATSIGVAVGAALGYFTASTDLEAERKTAREAGFREGVETTWLNLGSETRRALVRATAARAWSGEPQHPDGTRTAPPHVVLPRIVVEGQYTEERLHIMAEEMGGAGVLVIPRAGELFDQDAPPLPPEGAAPTELRGDR